jgi:acyl-CoA synthetase (AMP-forming)/AMP-acid ligase II
MSRTYERAGGLASGDEVTLLLRKRTSQPISLLARWIAGRRVVSFAWKGQFMLPLFQFELAYMSVRAPVSAVLDELAGVFDDGELAAWFALPNAWLQDAAPVDVLDVDHAALLNAARADRYVARG